MDWEDVRLKSSTTTTTDSHDPLTGLPDRAAMRARLTEACGEGGHRPGFGLILLDIDRFKIINYGYGDKLGDSLLRWIAEQMRRLMPPGCLVSRWGGQEFMCLLPAADRTVTDSLAATLRRSFETANPRLDNHDVHVTASFGTAIYPDDGTNLDRLLGAAGAALHQAKSTGRNRVVAASGLNPHWFGAGLMLSEALRGGRVIPAYQPIVDLSSGETVGEEALARVRSTSGKLIPASAFIEAARELQLTHQIDRAIIFNALEHCAAQPGRQRLTFVNISGNLLRHPDVIREILAKARAACANHPAADSAAMPIVIEITERELLADLAHARDLLRPFEDFGFRLALDDFGSGYSSYRYLADLPVSFLKIEGSLIRRIREKRVRTIVQGIQHTAVELGIATLAEYVEDAEIADIVRELGIDLGQGYYFGPPAAN